VGEQTFILPRSCVLSDNWGGFGLGPRSLAARRSPKSGLLATGTLMETNYRLDLPDGATSTPLRPKPKRF
jgi:putative ABC transport system permease protein